MGFADLCLNLGITYGSDESLELMEQVMGFIRRESWIASMELGSEKGVFPEFEKNENSYAKFLYEEVGLPREMPLTPRNYEVTTIAPTGTISLVAETSSGCERPISSAAAMPSGVSWSPSLSVCRLTSTYLMPGALPPSWSASILHPVAATWRGPGSRASCPGPAARTRCASGHGRVIANV
jgi:hypothetical protein